MATELLDIIKTSLTADGAPDGAADYVMTYDASADALKKVLIENLPSSGGVSGLGSTDNAVVRADGVGGTAAQGSLMTIDDNGAPSIPDTQYLTSSAKRMIGYNSAAPVVNINPDGVQLLQLNAGSGGITFQHYFGDQIALFDDDATAGNVRMKIWDVTSAALVRVSRGASDSGGSGFRLLRIPN